MDLVIAFIAGAIFSAIISTFIVRSMMSDVKWRPEVALQNGDKIMTATGKGGEWYAFHDNPYICVEASSRDAAVGLAVAALSCRS